MLATAATIAVLLALVVGLLAVPLVVVVDGERFDRLKVRWQVRWLFGLVNLGSTKRVPESPALPHVERRTDAATRDRGRGRRVGLAVLSARGFVRRVVRFAMTLLRRTRLDRFHVDAAFGFEDPAATGIVYGCLSPLVMLVETRGLDVHYRPLFDESGLRGDCAVTIQIRPLAIVGTIVAFIVSPPVVRAIRAAWRARR